MTCDKVYQISCFYPSSQVFTDTNGYSDLVAIHTGDHDNSTSNLLPSGICGVDGGFERGDAVRLCDRDGKEFARGVVSYSLPEILRIMGRQCVEIETLLGYKYRDEVVCRDDLVLTGEGVEEEA